MRTFTGMPVFTDQIGRSVALSHIPKRIISLVPSQTELLYSLGLEESVVGITRFCVHPPSWFREKSRIGGTKAIDPARIDALQPDLIIANKEENERPQVEALAERYPVWVSDVKTLADALAMIRSVGDITGTTAAADTLAEEIIRRFAALETAVTSSLRGASPTPRPQVAYLIWYNPWMAAGGDTFIHQMLTHAGFENVFADHTRFANTGPSAGGPVVRYGEIDLSDLAGTDITILLSSEPYPFRERHIREVKESLPQARVELVDGEMFSWYGSRMLLAPAYFQQLHELLLT
ncbi:MAG TPA: helical backbone metal receptor [Puia sp.]|nr:helical backbone metal receptor [Puia sp.]